MALGRAALWPATCIKLNCMRAFQPRPYKKFQENPHWKDYLLFNEYYHGDNGMGLGASHQTGWSDLVANLIDEWRR
jgi:hypothetical protein